MPKVHAETKSLSGNKTSFAFETHNDLLFEYNALFKCKTTLNAKTFARLLPGVEFETFRCVFTPNEYLGAVFVTTGFGLYVPGATFNQTTIFNLDKRTHKY